MIQSASRRAYHSDDCVDSAPSLVGGVVVLFLRVAVDTVVILFVIDVVIPSVRLIFVDGFENAYKRINAEKRSLRHSFFCPAFC